MNIIYILKLIASRLNIDDAILLNAVKNKINEKELNDEITDPEKIKKINELLDVDSRLLEFEKNNILHDHTKQNFNKLKENLGKLQILVLIKKLSESTGCNDIINTLLNILNNKFENINSILTSNLVQTGGTNKKYYKKYIKYKTKYLKLLLTL